MNSFKPSNPVYFELTAITVTALLKFIIMDWLGMRAFYITGTSLFWAGYVYYRYSYDHNVLKYWGFRKENFLKSWTVLLPFLVLCLSLAALFAHHNNAVYFSWQILPVLILYPLWGIIQQFIFLCIITLNLQRISFFSRNNLLLFLLVALIFSLIHYPYFSLMIFTFAMEIVFVLVYWKWRNLWAIGLAHGWIATFILYYVLNRNLWSELFAWF